MSVGGTCGSIRGLFQFQNGHMANNTPASPGSRALFFAGSGEDRPALAAMLMVLLCIGKALAFEVTGTVFNQDKNPLIGVSVSTNINGMGTLSDNNGAFVLECDSSVKWITFSSVGYESRQFKATEVPSEVILKRSYYEEDPITPGDKAIAFRNKID